MEISVLNKTFDYTQELINKNPENENKIIADYNAFILKVSNKNKPYIRSATYTDSDLLPLSATPNIKILNNFQTYNDGYTNTQEEPIFIPTTPFVVSNSYPNIPLTNNTFDIPLNNTTTQPTNNTTTQPTNNTTTQPTNNTTTQPTNNTTTQPTNNTTTQPTNNTTTQPTNNTTTQPTNNTTTQPTNNTTTQPTNNTTAQPTNNTTTQPTNNTTAQNPNQVSTFRNMEQFINYINTYRR